MGKIIDISDKLTKEVKKIKISEGKEFRVNDSFEAVLIINQLMQRGDIDEIEMIMKALDLTVGKEAIEEMKRQKFTFANFQTFYVAVMAAISNMDFEEMEKQLFRRQQGEQ